MATLREELLSLLNDDPDLTALTPGGWFDANEVFRDGVHVSNAPYEADGVTLQTFGVLRWRGSNPAEIARYSERRTVEVYFYADVGYGAIEAAKARVKELLDGQTVSGDDFGARTFFWMTDGGETPADELGGASSDMSRYYVILTRT